MWKSFCFFGLLAATFPCVSAASTSADYSIPYGFFDSGGSLTQNTGATVKGALGGAGGISRARASGTVVGFGLGGVLTPVGSINSQPVMEPISNITVEEGSTVSISPSAIDPDGYFDTIQFSWNSNPPSGASLDPNSGAFRWSPTEAQGPSAVTISIRVSDSGNPPLSASQTFTVTVLEVNSPPEVGTLAAQSVLEEHPLTFSVVAADSDIPPNTLSFNLGTGAPAGSSLDSATGVFRWTPTESDGPGIYDVTVTVSDNGNPSLSTPQSVAITVAEENTPPVMAGIADQVIEEGQLLTVLAAAADRDLPFQTLTFRLTGEVPSGASIDSKRGIVSWTPSEEQGPGTFRFTVEAADSGSPSLMVSQSFQVVVLEGNSPPEIPETTAQTILEDSTLRFVVNAVDRDVPKNRLAFSLGPDAPPGASINSVTGEFVWTPGEGEGPGQFPVTVVVMDDGTPSKSALGMFTVTVTEVNRAPTLAPVADRTVRAGTPLNVLLAAEDPDVPSNELTFSLGPGAPVGARIGERTGELSWSPPASGTSSSHSLSVIVSDNGTPAMQASQTLKIVVTPSNLPPVFGGAPEPVTVPEGRLLDVTISASDTDASPNSLQYLLGPGAPEGMTIDPRLGQLTWTPTEGHGPSTNQITIVAVDDGIPPLAATNRLEVIVTEINEPPTLSLIEDQRVEATELLNVVIRASDSDLPANKLSYRLGPNAPVGAAIDLASGVLSWTPTILQGPATNRLSVVVTDNGVPPLSVSQEFTVVVTRRNQAPVLAIISDQFVDEGTTLSFTVSATDLDQPGQSLGFSLAPGAPVGVRINPSTGVFDWTPTEIQAPSTNVVTVRVTDNGVPPLSASRDVRIVGREVNLPPSLRAISNQTIGRGDTLRFTVTATDPDLPVNTLRFSLEPNAPAGAVIDPVTGLFVWPSTAAQSPSTNSISVRVTDNGTPPLSDFRSFVVVVRGAPNQPPTISQIASQTIQENTASGQIAFSISDPDTPLENLSVEFASSNPVLIPLENISATGSGTNRLVVITPGLSQIGTATITASVRDNTGAIARTTFDVTVKGVAPSIVREPNDRDVVTGASVVFDVAAAGTQPLTYQWRFNGDGISGATNTLLALSNVRFEDAGVYSVTVSNRVGVVVSRDARLSVRVPIRITSQPASQRVLSGETVRFSVGASGVPPLRYRWQVNGVAIAGGTNSVLSLGNVGPILSGDYSVVVTDGTGATVTSLPAALAVLVPVTITRQPESQSATEGTNAVFTVAANGIPEPRYQWRFNGVDLPGQTNATLALAGVTVADVGNYAAIVSNALGSTQSEPATLRMITHPALIRSPANQVVTLGGEASFTVTALGSEPLRYRWRFLAPAAAPGGGPLPGTEIAGATSRTLTISNAGAANEGDYFAIVSNAAGEVVSGAARLTVRQPVAITQQPLSQRVAAGTSARFEIVATGGEPLLYQWRHNGADIPSATNSVLALLGVARSDAGEYQVRVANSSGSEISTPAALTIDLPVTIVTQPKSHTVTLGAGIALTVSAVGTAPFQYQWRFAGQDISGATDSVLAIEKVQRADAGRYSVEVENSVGAVVSADAVLAVIIPPTIQVQPLSQSANLGGGVTFSVDALGDAPLDYQWRKNGNNISGARDASFSIPTVEAGHQGAYSVVVQNGGGAVTSAAATLTVILPPIESSRTAQDLPPPLVASQGTFDGGSNEIAQGLFSRRSTAPPAGGDRWFSWKAPSSGIAEFSTRGSTFDTVMTIYTGVPPTLKEVGSDDDSGGFLSSRIQFNAVEGTTYLIRVGGFGGAVGRIVVGFYLSPTTQKLPEIIVPPRNVLVAPGQAAELAVEVQGADLTYQWFANGVGVENAAGASYRISSASAANALRYTVMITGDSSSAGQTYLSSPAAYVQVGTAETGVVDKFKSLSRSGGLPQLQSLNRGHIQSPARSDSVWLAFHTLGLTKEDGEPNHCDESGGASAWFVYQPSREGVLRVSTEGSSFDTVLAIYSGPGTDFESLILETCDNDSGADGRASVASIPVKQGAWYYIAVDGVQGATGAAKLSCELGGVPEFAQQPLTQTVAVDQPFTLFVNLTTTPGSVTDGGSLVGYQWFKDGIPLAGKTADRLFVERAQPEDAGDYTVLASNFAGVTTSQPARIVIGIPPSITAQPSDQVVPRGSAVNFEVTASGTAPVVYQWRFQGNNLAGATNLSLRIPDVQGAQVGSYTVLVQNSVGSVESAPAELALNTAPSILVPPVDQVAPLGGAATFSVTAEGTPPLSYQWRYNGVEIAGATAAELVLSGVGPADAGDYTVAVSNSADVVVSAGARLVLRIPLALIDEPKSQAVAAGNSVSFFVRASGHGPLSYQWKKNGSVIAGATGPVLALANVQAGEAGSYTVLVMSEGNSIESQPAALVVGIAPVITQHPASLALFAGADATLSVEAAGEGTLAYQWFKASEPLAGETRGTLVLNNVQAVDSGYYSVTVSDAWGVAVSDLAIVAVQQLVSEIRFDAVAGFQFRLTVPEGSRATVQSSSDLINWTEATPGPLTGVTNFQDPPELAGDLRFYRVIVE